MVIVTQQAAEHQRRLVQASFAQQPPPAEQLQPRQSAFAAQQAQSLESSEGPQDAGSLRSPTGPVRVDFELGTVCWS